MSQTVAEQRMSLNDKLYKLFLVDSQVRGLRTRVVNAEKHLNSQKKQLDIVTQQKTELTAKQKKLKAEIGNLEVEGKAIDQRLEKLREDLNSSSTNKQYTAVLTELNTVKAGRAKIEDDELVQMEQLEQTTAELAHAETQCAEKAKLCDMASKQLAERNGEIQERLSELERERREATVGIPEDVLAIFDELADYFEGEAVAPVEEIDRRNREYACGACHIHLPFSLVAKLITLTDAVERCGNCSRFLYMQPDMKGSFAKK